MDSLEHVSHSYPTGQLVYAKSNNSMEHLGGGKRDSAYSSFSTSSGTPDYTLSKSNTASTENMVYKVGQWDGGGKHSTSGRNSHSLAAEGIRQDDRLTYFQMPGVSSGYDGPQTEDPASASHSVSSRISFGPVWNIPEKKKTASSSPPPPPPPTRSDSFAATKVHERGLAMAHPEGPDSHPPSKASSENRRSHNISPKNDSDSFYSQSDKAGQDQFSSNKRYSHASDVRQPAHVSQPYDPRHHSEKSTFYPQFWTASAPKPQTVGAYYYSMQELPTNGSAQHSGQMQRKNLSSSTGADQSTESSGHSRYYCVTTCQPTQPSPVCLSERRGSATELRKQQQPYSSHTKDSNAYSKHQGSTVLETPALKPSSDDWGGQRGYNTPSAESQYNKPPELRRALPPQHREPPQDIKGHGPVNNKICPQVTPMLHSLSLDTAGQDDRTRGRADSDESIEAKQLKRNDRYATTLRNEIQMRRANLQKSKSAAALPRAECETEDDQDIWKSSESTTPTSANSSFSNAYKDHLKEVQEKVLKATSFRRRDLEPILLEQSTAEALLNYPSSMHSRKDVTPQPAVTESLTGNSGGQVARIGGRKRFAAEKKVKSFSEPDKIHEVGMKEGLTPSDNISSSLHQQKHFEDGRKPDLRNHMPLESPIKNRNRELASVGATEDPTNVVTGREYVEESLGVSTQKQSIQDQQRLGTFAEYEATWNIQKKPPEKRVSGRYRSADNILDPGTEERTRTSCFHERSKSSPSADIYGQVRHKIRWSVRF